MVALSKFNSGLNYAEFVEKYSYSAFGETQILSPNNEPRTTSLFGNPYMFTGREYEPETGLYYYRARFYNPTIGRFLQTDPIGYLDSMNAYQYCGNNPINWIDPWGLLSYLVSRPLGGDNKAFTHNFIVVNAKYVGDPEATIYSYGKTETGKVGRVDENTKGFSEGTYKTDIASWVSLAISGEAKDNTVRIPSPDKVVELYAKALLEDQPYAAVAGPFGANSNSAAQAIANAAACRKLPTPGEGRISPGAGSWDEIKFDINKILAGKKGCKK